MQKGLAEKKISGDRRGAGGGGGGGNEEARSAD